MQLLHIHLVYSCSYYIQLQQKMHITFKVHCAAALYITMIVISLAMETFPNFQCSYIQVVSFGPWQHIQCVQKTIGSQFTWCLKWPYNIISCVHSEWVTLQNTYAHAWQITSKLDSHNINYNNCVCCIFELPPQKKILKCGDEWVTIRKAVGVSFKNPTHWQSWSHFM